MEYPRHNGSGTQTSKTQHRRPRGRSLNVPTVERVASKYYMTEDLPDAEMSSQYQNVRPGYATFACTTMQPVVASHKTQTQHSRRLSPKRVEPQEYYENYYTPPKSPVAGSSNTYPVYEKSSAESTGTRDQLDETVYEDKVDEGEVEENQVDVYDYVPIPLQQERLLRKECYSAREVPCYEHNVTQQRRHRKLLHSNYDMPQDAYAHLLKAVMLEKLKDKLPDGYVERVGWRANKEQLLLAQGKEEPTKPLKQYVPQSDFTAGEEYFKNLETMFRDVTNDVEELVDTKEVGSEGRKARKNVPAQTYYSKY